MFPISSLYSENQDELNDTAPISREFEYSELTRFKSSDGLSRVHISSLDSTDPGVNRATEDGIYYDKTSLLGDITTLLNITKQCNYDMIQG